ncbi:MAG: FprA family A-type flavoprotein [Oscillospiraceae bacterium]|nr:FprA family A-type flavoprotein [Oscillospiraceae bacterium]
MTDLHVSDAIRYVGADDTTITLFEGQYPVPNGVSYNSYVILDSKIAVMDTVDRRGTAAWLENLVSVLDGRKPDYLVIQHMEPDHAGSIGLLAEKYPEMTLVGNAKTFSMLPKFFPGDYTGRTLTVKEGDTLSLGTHTLTFVMAPMVHWPEVMVSYESSEKVLFSADGFGTFGANCCGQEWIAEARRYYFNIVGKYGAQVQALLKKASGLDIQTICPLHGPVLKSDLGYYLGKYDLWSRYEPEEDGVLIAYASIHGNTAKAAQKMREILAEQGCANISMRDLDRCDQAEAVADAFRYSRMVAMSSTYDGGLFPPMDHFMAHLRDKTYRNRRVALIENGSWAPSAAKHMRTYLEALKDITICPTVHTIQSAVKENDIDAMRTIAKELLEQ